VADERVLVACPKCGDQQEDFDGVGVVYCEKCGFCTHAAITGDTCNFCGAVDEPPSLATYGLRQADFL
jgi:hypothetical protein